MAGMSRGKGRPLCSAPGPGPPQRALGAPQAAPPSRAVPLREAQLLPAAPSLSPPTHACPGGHGTRRGPGQPPTHRAPSPALPHAPSPPLCSHQAASHLPPAKALDSSTLTPSAPGGGAHTLQSRIPGEGVDREAPGSQGWARRMHLLPGGSPSSSWAGGGLPVGKEHSKAITQGLGQARVGSPGPRDQQARPQSRVGAAPCRRQELDARGSGPRHLHRSRPQSSPPPASGPFICLPRQSRPTFPAAQPPRPLSPPPPRPGPSPRPCLSHSSPCRRPRTGLPPPRC